MLLLEQINGGHPFDEVVVRLLACQAEVIVIEQLWVSAMPRLRQRVGPRCTEVPWIVKGDR